MKLSFHVSITPVSLCPQLMQLCVVPASALALWRWISHPSFWRMSLSCLLAPVLLLCLIPLQRHFSFITELPPPASAWPNYCVLLSAFLHFSFLAFAWKALPRNACIKWSPKPLLWHQVCKNSSGELDRSQIPMHYLGLSDPMVPILLS